MIIDAFKRQANDWSMLLLLKGSVLWLKRATDEVQKLHTNTQLCDGYQLILHFRTFSLFPKLFLEHFMSVLLFTFKPLGDHLNFIKNHCVISSGTLRTSLDAPLHWPQNLFVNGNEMSGWSLSSTWQSAVILTTKRAFPAVTPPPSLSLGPWKWTRWTGNVLFCSRFQKQSRLSFMIRFQVGSIGWGPELICTSWFAGSDSNCQLPLNPLHWTLRSVTYPGRGSPGFQDAGQRGQLRPEVFEFCYCS